MMCFTWIRPSSPLAMNRNWRLRSESLPWCSSRGLLVLCICVSSSCLRSQSASNGVLLSPLLVQGLQGLQGQLLEGGLGLSDS